MLQVVRQPRLKLFFSNTTLAREIAMTTEFNELLPVAHGDKAQVWIVGTREQVTHLINEFYVKRIVSDRLNFTPIIPAPFASGKYMSVLVR
jgi:hypothetical protein